MSKYNEYMNAAVANLIENAEYNKTTNHLTFNSDTLELPKGITMDSLNEHTQYINHLSVAAEAATAEYALTNYSEENKVLTIDSTLRFSNSNINSAFHIKEKVGDKELYGNSMTAVDYLNDVEEADWLNRNRVANHDLAKALFSK